jgi:hypothetical protein
VPSATLGFDLKGDPEAPPGAAYQALLMAQTPQYETRARAVARILAGRNILNVCGELNTVVHHDHRFVGGLNQNAFGAAYYASALIHLIRGGADLEMRWTATAHDDAYGLITMQGEATPACLAKQLFAQHVRFGDWVSFPDLLPDNPDLDAVMVWGNDGRRSGVFVNTGPQPRALITADWDGGPKDCRQVLRLDTGTGGRVVREPFDGTVTLDGYGIAVLSNAAQETEID